MYKDYSPACSSINCLPIIVYNRARAPLDARTTITLFLDIRNRMHGHNNSRLTGVVKMNRGHEFGAGAPAWRTMEPAHWRALGLSSPQMPLLSHSQALAYRCMCVTVLYGHHQLTVELNYRFLYASSCILRKAQVVLSFTGVIQLVVGYSSKWGSVGSELTQRGLLTATA